MHRLVCLGAAGVLSLIGSIATAGIVTVNGNGNSGFGGTVGGGQLTLNHNGTTLSGTFSRGAGSLNDAVVLYFDTDLGATGFTSSSTFTDTADGLRRAISGRSGGNQTIANFAAGFRANYAIAFDQNFAGLWALAGGGAHNFIGSAGWTPTGNNNAASHGFSVNLSAMGITLPGSEIRFVGTYISTSGYRSNEAFGNISITGSTDGSGNPGFNSQITFSNYFSAVPEPTSALLVAAFGLIASVRRQRRAG
ncbi:MAG: PEP-CTERM sorting domain-containing protein [Planctomycetaceae bacterium]|nr:PEP-CTERM sorting domain-containing protein [Planctomycetaceae bacterium]